MRAAAAYGCNQHDPVTGNNQAQKLVRMTKQLVQRPGDILFRNPFQHCHDGGKGTCRALRKGLAAWIVASISILWGSFYASHLPGCEQQHSPRPLPKSNRSLAPFSAISPVIPRPCGLRVRPEKALSQGVSSPGFVMDSIAVRKHILTDTAVPNYAVLLARLRKRSW